jgi:hypothetical protein
MARSKKTNFPQAALATTKVDWSQWDPWAGSQGLIGVAIPLALGFFLNHPSYGAIAAGGAMYIGMGSYDKQTRTSTSFMFLGSLVISLAALTGSLCGRNLWEMTLLACLWAFAAGMLSILAPPLSFIGIKTLVTLLIAGGYPSSWEDALQRAALVLSGALLQTLLFYIENSYFSNLGAPRRLSTPRPAWKKSWNLLLTHLSFRSEVFQHALRLALCVAIAEPVSRTFLTHNAYWLPLTAVIVLRPDFEQTLVRGFARVAGTILGAVLTTLIVMWLNPNGITLALLTLPCAWLCFSLFKASYALYSVCITAYIVFMLSFIGIPEMSVLTNRLMATVAGGTFALVLFALWPNRKAST